ncbi:MAG TPA: copper homeostasis protein CutC [Bryobacteraceae bacterium]|nr:copper homeostasis protein CutC [Bryobacteraceae bacterium]
MPKLLEVIVTSVEEAREAELGGADRIELVRALETGGLTPTPEVVEQVVNAVSIPVRVMLRENASMSASDPREIGALQASARQLAQLPIDGFVLGFVKNGSLDLETMGQVLADVAGRRATLHRAFEYVGDSVAAIREAKTLPQIDRILTSGGDGSWQQRKARLLEWRAAAEPEIRILIGVGLQTSVLTEMANHSEDFEFHAGRAARFPHTTAGLVSREQVAKLKALL